MDNSEIFSNIEAEAAVLGTIIMNNNYLRRIEDILEPHHFYNVFHGKLYSHILLTAVEKQVTEINLKEFFVINEEFGYLKEIIGAASTILDIRQTAQIIVEAWQKRQASIFFKEASLKLLEQKATKTIAELENNLAGLCLVKEVKKTRRMADIAREMDKKNESGIKPKVISTHIKELDDILGSGFFSKRLYVIMASAGSGKTSLGLQFMIKAESDNKKTCFISLEMSEEEATNKVISHLQSLPLWKLQKGLKLTEIEQGAKLQAIQTLDTYNLSINDSTSPSVVEIERIIKRELEKEHIQLVVIDYIQIIPIEQNRNKNMADLIKQNSTAIKNMAKKYDIAIVLLSQIKRNDNKKPTLEDLKGSGGIGEDADVVMALFCENPKQKIKDVDVIINKNRWGRMGEFTLSFDGEFGRFIEKSIINNF